MFKKIKTLKIHFKFKIKNFKLLSIPEPPTGFEPITYCLQNSSSTVELGWHRSLSIINKLQQKTSTGLNFYFNKFSNFRIRVLAL